MVVRILAEECQKVVGYWHRMNPFLVNILYLTFDLDVV